ncbi:MAG TPA: flagellar basal-body MS-ring/collar protein FliF [Terracidiphilus sp.]|jgi:flagellar M-ring protein FliF
MASYQKIFEQAKQFWASRTGRQKAVLLAGSGASALLLAAFVWMIGSPDYKPLYSGLETADAQTLSAQLDAQGIPHQTSADGKTISVPANKLDAARMQTASQGGPRSGRMGFELFDKMSWGQTEFDEKVEYQRALEGELERSIQTLSDVESARVHLVMPAQSVFLDQQRTGKASVVLKLRQGSLSKPAVLAISRLVSGAVDNIRPEDVSIVDADSDRSLGIGKSMDGTDESAGNELTARLISTLEPVVGVDKIRASVNVEYNQGTTEESQERYDPSVSAVLSEQKSQDSATGGAGVPGGAAQGVPGATSNIPTAQGKPNAAPNQSPGQTSTTQSTQYGVNKTVTHTVTPAGRIQRITAALLVDDQIVKSVQKGKTTYARQKRSQEELTRIQELAKAAIGFDEKRGDSITVQNLSFEADPTGVEAPAANWATTTQKAINDYSSLLRPASFLVLFLLGYFFLIRPIQKHALSAPAIAATLPQNALPAAHNMALTAPPAEKGEDTIRASQLKAEAAELMKQKPVHTARALQAWLREEHS